jgi:hypothetical protein
VKWDIEVKLTKEKQEAISEDDLEEAVKQYLVVPKKQTLASMAQSRPNIRGGDPLSAAVDGKHDKTACCSIF